MSLKIFLLGQFRLQAKEVWFELPSRPAQSLLAYLALNAGVSHRREKLASLLWPETDESNARSYLRQALWRIRKSLESVSLAWQDYLQLSDIEVCFDDTSDYWLDAARILESLETPSADQLIEVLSLYRGELLPGFYDEWVVAERDRLEAAYHHKMNLLLELLLKDRRWGQAIQWSEQWIRLGYAPEPAFRALMRAHAGSGDQVMVNASYRRCVESLNRELGVGPAPETQLLYEQLLRREVDRSIPNQPVSSDLTDRRLPFLEEKEPRLVERSVFVARQQELAQLERFLGLALSGDGRVVFVTGEAGSGKTALIHEFTRRAMAAHADLLVASGNCNAYTGIGVPYLPFREILELLTGDVEARWTVGAITSEHARRLWNTVFFAAQVLVEVGPDLIDAFVSRAALLERVLATVPVKTDWLARLDGLAERKPTGPGIPGPLQSDLFEQYTRVLQALARKVPLVLVVDDLQWADLGSISLLFHLVRRLAGSRILILGAYRPEDVITGRDGERHPLDPVVNEFQRDFGNITINLSQAESRDFVEALLDSEPNRLGVEFRDMLYRQTRGHPLFTIELIRGLQERGDLGRDPQGRWVEGPALVWERLPARVEAVIAERISRLAQPLTAALRTASVEGEVFTAEVVARVQAADDRELVERLSGELDRRHHLVHAQAIERLGARRLSRYRFRNYLFQKYLYDSLDEVERAYIHENVGKVLEDLYGEQASEIAVQLAWHFQEAGIAEKTIHYLHEAGEKAVQLSAYQEGIAHLNAALALLATLPDSPQRNQQELPLQLILAVAWQGIKGYQAPQVEIAYTRARQLCQQMRKSSQLGRVVGELSIVYYAQAKHQEARETAEEAISLAQQAQDPLLVAIQHAYLGFILFCLGEFATARDHLNQMTSFYNPKQYHNVMVFLRGSDLGPTALAYDACCLWCLGYPDQALKRSQQALALAQELDHAFTLADVLCYAGCVFSEMRRDASALKEYAEQMLLVAKDIYLCWLAQGNWRRGEALAMLGQFQEGIAQMRQGIAEMLSIGGRINMTSILGSLAEAQSKAGQIDKALTTLAEALAQVDETNERFYEAELHRLRGELLLMQGNKTTAEASLQKAIEIARRQCARSWELRATISLARLWQGQGRTDEARQSLLAIYNWFTEGFDTPDLIVARTLIEELS